MDYTADELKVYKSRSASGGVNNKLFPLDIREDQAVQLVNIDTSTVGLRKKRQGTTLTATGFSGRGILDLQFFAPGISAIDSEILIVAAGATTTDHRELWSWNGVGTFTMRGTLTGFTAFNDAEITVGYDLNIDGGYVAVISTGAQVPRYYYNGVTLAHCSYGVSMPPFQTGMEYFLNRGFGVGVAGSRNSVYFSDVASWTVTGFGDTSTSQFRRFILGGGTGQRIVMIKGFRQKHLMVFMEDRIEVLDMTEDVTATADVAETYADPRQSWSRTVVHTEFGCGARRTVVNVGEDIYFMDQYGNIRSLARTINDVSQGVRSHPISDAIQGYISRINPQAMGRCAAAYFKNFYILSVPIDSSTVNDTTFVYDVTRDAWDGPWTFGAVSPRFFTVGALSNANADPDDQTQTLYFADNTTVRRMFQDDGFTDNGTDYQWLEETKMIDFGAYESDKIWYRMEPLFQATASVGMFIEANVDSMGYTCVGYVNPLGGSVALPQDLPYTIGGQGIVRDKLTLEHLPRGRAIQFRVSGTCADEIKYLGFHLFAWIEGVDYTHSGEECD